MRLSLVLPLFFSSSCACLWFCLCFLACHSERSEESQRCQLHHPARKFLLKMSSRTKSRQSATQRRDLLFAFCLCSSSRQSEAEPALSARMGGTPTDATNLKSKSPSSR